MNNSIKNNLDWSRLNMINLLLVYADDISLFGEKIHKIKKSTRNLLEVIKLIAIVRMEIIR
jgi:hypothetical protein